MDPAAPSSPPSRTPSDRRPRRACGCSCSSRLRAAAAEAARPGRGASCRRSTRRVAATVHNVVGRLPGQRSHARGPARRALRLRAHGRRRRRQRDGRRHPARGGARPARRPQPRNDVIFLFTDGEEQRPARGAARSCSTIPGSYGVGVALNFDDPGSSIAVADVRDQPRTTACWSRQFFAAAPDPYGSSLMYEVSRRQPIITDFRRFLARGIPGMSFGALDGPGYMDTGYDTLAAIDPRGSLQHQGETALARRGASRRRWTSGTCTGPTSSTSTSSAAPGVVYGGFVRRAGLRCARPRRVRRRPSPSPARRRLLTRAGGGALGAGQRRLARRRPAAPRHHSVWAMYRSAYEQRVWTETGVVISDYYRLGPRAARDRRRACDATASLLRRLRAWDLAVAALSWWAAASVGRESHGPGSELPAHLAARRPLAWRSSRRRGSATRPRVDLPAASSSPWPGRRPASCC